jgi:S-DNA-T family DNA segregation ATPase FtsK/SpoIIIE
MIKKSTPLQQSREAIKEMSEAIQATFSDFEVPVKIVDAVEGYRQFHFYLQPQKPVRMKSILTFADDLRYALSSDKVEIEAPIPDQKLIGITVPKKGPFPELSWSDQIKTKEFISSSRITVPVGIDEFGESVLIDLGKMPHMLIAGASGSGKSVLLHSFINSLLEKNTPETLRLILCDPKRVELAIYNDLPELLTPVIFEPKKVLRALSWAIKEMERRYEILAAEKVQNISQYHKEVYEPSLKSKKKSEELPESLPFIFIFVDELADVMHAYPKEMEAIIVRLTQMSKTVGIHLVLATQRPSSSVLTGAIKSNIPSRIALSLASYVDSRMIIDQNGAEKLVGSGDMLFMDNDTPQLRRLQGYIVSTPELSARMKRLKKESYDAFTLDLDPQPEAYFSRDVDVEDMYEDARRAVIEVGKASTSYLQRKLRIGYSRAARLMDLLEEGGVIGPQTGSEPREILIDKE